MNRLIRQFLISLDEAFVPLPDDGKKVKHYEIYHRQKGTVVGKAKTRAGAARSIDTHDNKYGGYAHRARIVYEEEIAEDAVPTNGVGGGAIAGANQDPPGNQSKLIRRLKKPSEINKE